MDLRGEIMLAKTITREKHLDHMVKVVPIIVLAYAVQCYFISQLSPVEMATDGLLFLGACLGMMIAGFVTYDLTHIVKIEDQSVVAEIKWLKYRREIYFHQMKEIIVSDPSESFSTLKIVSTTGAKISFFFVDDAENIKKWMEQKRAPQEEKLAA